MSWSRSLRHFSGHGESKAPTQRTRTTDGVHDFRLRQAAVAVRVDEREDLPGGVEELLLEGLELAPVRGGLGLAGRAALLDLRLEGLLDRRFPAL